MFEPGGTLTADLEALLSTLSGPALLACAGDDAERVAQLDLLERVKAACAAAQAKVTVDLADSQGQVAQEWRQHASEASDAGDFETWRQARERARAASCPEADDPSELRGERRVSGHGRGRRARRARVEAGVAAQVALARRESPHAGSRLVRLAFALTYEMPHLLALLERGLVSERRASLVVQECAALSFEQRGLVDAELHHSVGEELGRFGERELTSRVRAISYRLDAQAVADRAAYAERERRVTLRPAPDTMCWLTALLPAAQGVGVLAALTKAADSARAAGDARSKGQLMADTLVERVTGQASAGRVPVEVQLVVTDRALLADDETPACLTGYGTVPAGWARRLITPTAPFDGPAPDEPTPNTDNTDADNTKPDLAVAAQVWLRRLYTHPADGTLVAMESRRRIFDGALRAFLLARDGGICRTPGCGAPVRHLDHVKPYAAGGPTSAGNGQGLCVRCNLVKELTGWHARVVHPGEPPGHRHRMTTTATARATACIPSRSPPPPGTDIPRPRRRCCTKTPESATAHSNAPSSSPSPPDRITAGRPDAQRTSRSVARNGVATSSRLSFLCIVGAVRTRLRVGQDAGMPDPASVPPIRYATASDGVSIAWQAFGSGPPLVWMPSLGNLVAQWRIPFLRRAYEALASSLRLVLYDGRGTGSSSRQVDPDDLGVDAQLRDLDAVVEAGGLEQYALLGYYHSVPAAITHAATHPERVTRLVLFGGSARTRDVMSPSQTQALLSLVGQDWDLFAQSAAHAWLGWQAGEAGRLLADSFRTAASPTVVTAMFREAERTDVHDLLADVTASTLVVHRQSDRQMPLEVSAALAAALPAGRLAQLPGDRPALFLENLSADVELLTSFVRNGTVIDVPVGPRPPDDRLTPRERDVLRRLAAGDTNAAVARVLGITEHTVERHVANLYRKIGARGRADATAYALRNGYA
ncbi:MAG: alpha/beta fold hydrolase [Lapillicoccus sp.]